MNVDAAPGPLVDALGNGPRELPVRRSVLDGLRRCECLAHPRPPHPTAPTTPTQTRRGAPSAPKRVPLEHAGLTLHSETGIRQTRVSRETAWGSRETARGGVGRGGVRLARG